MGQQFRVDRNPKMRKLTVVTLTDREVVKYAVGEVLAFLTVRLVALALLAWALWWAWGRIEPWSRKLTG
jgi:hypothetical protein